jgi:hypothetical protein
MDRRAFIRFIPAIALLGCASHGQQMTEKSGMRFSEAERNLITTYYKLQGRPRTPDQDKATSRARVGEKLMSGERPNKLPTALDAQLPTLPDPYTRLTLGADVILVNRNTHDILDIIPQVAY